MIKYYKNIDKIGYVPIEDVKMKFIVSGCFDLPLTSKNLCESGQIAMAYYIVNAFGRYFEGNGNIKRATNAEAISYLLVHEWYQREQSEKGTNTIEERHENGRFKEGNCFNYIQEISYELVTALHFFGLGIQEIACLLGVSRGTIYNRLYIYEENGKRRERFPIQKSLPPSKYV